jgi:ABC-type phosphate/phosphonate transport system substrate-binding protein
MIASLPMYWQPETAGAWRAVWADVQAAGRADGLDLPDLTPPEAIPAPWTAHWLRDDLILSQTCSLPLRTALRGRVSYVGTFDFGLGGPPGSYHSVLVARTETVPDRIEVLALNGTDSQSGYAAGCDALEGGGPATAFARRAARYLETGSHRASLRAVAEGRADAAYLDAVSHRLAQRLEPEASRTRVVGRTPPTPGLPLITARHRDPAPLRATLRRVFDGAPDWRGAADIGGLRDFVVHDAQAYLAMPVPPAPAAIP